MYIHPTTFSLLVLRACQGFRSGKDEATVRAMMNTNAHMDQGTVDEIVLKARKGTL